MAQQSTEAYRFERKFAVSNLSRHEVERIIRCQRMMFHEVHAPRAVNNIYFDTAASSHYVATVEGLRDREKYRLRWYGPLLPSRAAPAQLEIKVRRNAMNRKRIFPLHGGFHGSSLAAVVGLLGGNDSLPDALKQALRCMRPVLLNTYQRQYFLSRDGRFRFTLDHDIHYLAVGSAGVPRAPRWHAREPVVVELKYDPGVDEPAREIAASLPFRLTKHSKYANGIERLKLLGAWRDVAN